jgi:hypothetical protein
MFYEGGILDSYNCTPKYSHAVIIIGYGEEPSKNPREPPKEYFIIRNSWGSSWGEGGYVRITASQGKFVQGMCNLYGNNYVAILKDVPVTMQLINSVKS